MPKNRCSNNTGKMHKYLTGTDGHRTIGRTWHASRWTNSAQVEAICSSTRNALLLPPLEMIRSPQPLTIRCLCLCLATLKRYLILAGRSRPPHGQPCSSGSNRGSRSVTPPTITVCHMKRSGVYCVPLSPLSRKSTYHPTCQASTQHLQGVGKIRSGSVRRVLPVAHQKYTTRGCSTHGKYQAQEQKLGGKQVHLTAYLTVPSM
jgi:hypothetical protein